MAGNALSMIGTGIIYFIRLIDFAILARVLLSFFVSPMSGVMGIMIMLTEPFIAPVRNVLMRFTGGDMRLDFSPFITMLLLTFLRGLVSRMFF